ncbi:MAG: hypothetical protein JOZ17_26770 [Acetobacteraceae bacterium]|nr:hypothetical protein [Acetobacteraceae bacterium]
MPFTGREMSMRSLTSDAAASEANWRSLVWATPSRSGSGSIRPVSQSSLSIHDLIVFGVAGPGVCFRRLKLVVMLFGGLESKPSSAALSSTVSRCAT